MKLALALLVGCSLFTAAVAHAQSRQLRDTVRVCFADAATHAPLRGVSVRDSTGSERVSVEACTFVLRGPVRFRRIGYQPLSVRITDSALVRLSPVYVSAVQLDTQRVVALANIGDQPRLRELYSVDTDSARQRGAGTVAQALSLLPFAQLRGTQGETAVSLRAARREQVLVTLDGIPLNDPATGIANVNELPLSLIASTAIAPGASPVSAGPGAIGGVVALTSSTKPIIVTRVGAFGNYGIEAVGRSVHDNTAWHGGLALHRAENNFPFVNTAGASGTATREQRVNNDEARATLFGSVHHTAAQFALSASVGERGMVGPMNVRAYDRDRAYNSRFHLRGATQLSRAEIQSGLRLMHLAYRDPAHPELNTNSRIVALNVDATGQIGVLSVTGGAGGDGVSGTGISGLSRARGYVAASHSGTIGAFQAGAGVRLDAVERNGAFPSFSAHVTRGWQVHCAGSAYNARLSARVAQALRVPTLYDLYFASPQRLLVRPLKPERVTHDAELESSLTWSRSEYSVTLGASVFSRSVRNAIVWFPGNFTWSPSNVGREALHGAESQLRFTSSWVTGGAWYSLYDALLHTGALQIPTPYVAREAGGANVIVDFVGAIASANARAMGRRPYTQGPRDPAFELPSVLLLDLAVSRRVITSRATLLATVSVDNATNEAWQPVRGFPSPGRSWAFALTISPQSP